MHQGLHTAVNIHQRILAAQTGIVPQFKELESDIPPMMGLAVGKKAASYSPQSGTKSGEDVMKLCFGNDLGFTSMPPLTKREKKSIADAFCSLLELSPSWRNAIQGTSSL